MLLKKFFSESLKNLEGEEVSSFEIKNILESLIENYSRFEDLIVIAKSLLEEIKQIESKKNASLSKTQDDL